MAKTLDFTKAKKQFLTITFVDGNKILVRTPTKRIMDSIIGLKDTFESVKEDEADMDALSEIYDACAFIMSNNIGKKDITPEYLSDVLDLEDLFIFFDAYTDFINEIGAVKN